jgi:hypothetical protein
MIRHSAKRVCRANKFLLVPKPRLIDSDSFCGDETPTAYEIVAFILEKIEVHRREIDDAQRFLSQIADRDPGYAQILQRLSKQVPLRVVCNNTVDGNRL